MSEITEDTDNAEFIESKDTDAKSDAGYVELEEAVEATDFKLGADLRSESQPNRYKTRSNYKSAPNTNSRKSSKKEEGLEKKVSQLREEAKKFGVDETEDVTSRIHEHLVQYTATENSEEGEDTKNGVLAFIHHYNTDTGKIEFLFEHTPDYYARDKGKLKLFGGTLKTTDKSSIDGFVREIGEEFESSAAHAIVRSLHDNGLPYGRKYYTENGQHGYTDILDIEVTSRILWQQIKDGRTKHDAGTPRFVSGDVVIRDLDEGYFAFGYGKLIKDFILEKSAKPLNITSTTLFSSSPPINIVRYTNSTSKY